MKCFPFMKDIEGKNCLIVGGGTVALRKAEKLLPFGVKIRVCAKEACPALSRFVCAEKYEAALVRGADLVIAATDDGELNARIARDCREAGVPVNSVDDKNNCDFYFPALIVRGNVTIGISTGGSSPALAAALREYIESVLPENLEEIAREAEKLRGGAGYESCVAAAFGRGKR